MHPVYSFADKWRAEFLALMSHKVQDVDPEQELREAFKVSSSKHICDT